MRRTPLVLTLSLAATLSIAAIAVAQEPGSPPCAITQSPPVAEPGQPFTLCGPEGAFFYNWYRIEGDTRTHLTGDRCYSSPGLPAGTYFFEMDISNLPDNGEFSKCPVEVVIEDGPKPEGRCWLTGGGAKVFGDGRGAPIHTFGGNINPGCSATAGDGGSWNDVWHNEGLHFHGQHIEVIRCGNVDGIPPGSSSPVTPFNFIEFEGTGTLTGVQGNDVDHGTVYFFGRYEDREEPGSHGQPDPNARDRYFLHVFSNPADPNGSTLMLVDQDGDPATVDPLVVTHGNLQMHITSCDDEFISVRGASRLSLGAGIEALSFAAPRPNPAMARTTLAFTLSRDSDVSLAIFDVVGRRVRDLALGRMPAGTHELDWDLMGANHSPVAKGIYFARLAVNGEVLSRTVTVGR